MQITEVLFTAASFRGDTVWGGGGAAWIISRVDEDSSNKGLW